MIARMFAAGSVVAISPSILIRFLSDNALKYYMLVMAALLIGLLGTNNHIGVYITYAFVPIASCLYFDLALVVKTGIFSYLIMLWSVYINSRNLYEVVYQGRPRLQMFIAYALGFTVEFVVVNAVLYFLVKRAKQMMEERYSAQEQNRMKTEFLSNMSHEIRTPMNAIIGMSEVALQKDMNEEVRNCLNIIKSSSTGLLEIINDILDISKVEAGKLNIIADAYTTKSLTDDMQAIIDARNRENKVPIYYHIQKNLPQCLEGDSVRIKQVMLNYASNAIKYTDTGRINITVGCEPLENGHILLTYQVKDTGQGIRREDMGKLFTMYSQLNQEVNHGKEGTGIGMSEEFLKHLFEPFSREYEGINSGYEGTGLGMSIVKQPVEKMGGTIEVKSKEGEASEFTVEIPFDAATKEDIQSPDAEMEESDISGVRVLLVEDNDLNMEIAETFLKDAGAVVTKAYNGQKAVYLFSENPPETYDVILMDVMMPVMNGYEATRKIRSLDRPDAGTIPIIAMTANAFVEDIQESKEAGMNEHISKPLDITKVLSAICKYIKK